MSLQGTALVLAAVALGLPASGAAQGLGDVAARAREERENEPGDAKKTESRSFSNDDLEGLAGRTNENSEGTVSTTGAASPSPDNRRESERSPDTTPEQRRTERERPYEDAVTQARGRVQSLEASIESLQQRLNPMSTTYVYGGTGGPVGGTQTDAEAQVRRQLDATQQQLDAAREGVAEAESRDSGSRRRDEPDERDEPEDEEPY